MAENILEKIIKNKEKKIDLLKKSLSIENLKTKIDENKSFFNFKEKIARQADASVIVTYGGTTVMTNVVAAKKVKIYII